MSEKEIRKMDLKTIYRFIDIHADMNGVKKDKTKHKQEKHVDNQQETYIDNIKF